MYTQYLAARTSGEHPFATLESHNLSTDLSTYPEVSRLGKMPLGCTSVRLAYIAGKMVGFKNRSRITSDRRYGCQRTSSFWQCSALWSSLPPVRVSSRSKNLSWLIQSRSAKSPCTQANTNKRQTGWAFAPVLTSCPHAEGPAWH